MDSNQPTINTHIELLHTLQTPSGLFLASQKGVRTGYDKAWLRDNFYTSLAFEEVGDWDTVHKLWRALLDIFIKHEAKINWAIVEKPHASWQYIHARYHPETFEEFWEEWGNKQNDAVGAILFKIADLAERGQSLIQTDADRRILQKLVDYLYSIQYWHDPDSGIWEHVEEIHASSIGAIIAALKKMAIFPFIHIPADMIEKGERAINELLPRESQSRFTDLALLSLIYPYNVVNQNQTEHILKNIEYHLVKKRGVIRYKIDHYYNRNIDGWSEEAEWTMGFSWLAIIYHIIGNSKKARAYLRAAQKTFIKRQGIPELYLSNSDKPNENIPLAWAESLFIVACKKIQMD